MMTETNYYQVSPYLPQRARRPTVLVLFGGAGDLAKRKLAPALYNLMAGKLLPESFAVVGAARTARSDEEYRRLIREAIERHSRVRPRAETLTELLGRFHYQPFRPGQEADEAALARRAARLQQADGGGCRLYYLATPPKAYAPIIDSLGRAGLAGRSPDVPSRIVIEKPVGSDLTTARSLNSLVARWFEESGVYRIDHFLGKETVQNLLVFRLANAIFEPLLTREYVHDVQITVAEDAGVAGRGPYYDSAGALRDMVQNHLLQLLCLVAMAPPLKLTAECIRDEKVKTLRSIDPLTPEQVAVQTVRGQYRPADGLPGYLAEDGVAGDSQTETYVACRLEVRNRRWAGVPFHLRAGKRLARRVGEIVVTFRREVVPLFGPEVCDWRMPNRLIFRLQPAQGISITFDAKTPGARMLLRPVRMDFDYESSFETASPEAYERLLLDALKGEASLFARADEVEQSWRIVDSIHQAWVNSDAAPLLGYPCGSWGPDRATRIFTDENTTWQTT